MILWFPHYKNVGGAEDIFQTKKNKGGASPHRAQWGSGNHCHRKLCVRKIIMGSKRQTHKRKKWINTKTPILAREATELQIVRGWERMAGKYPFMLALSLHSSLNICYSLATVWTRNWTSGLSSMAIMFLVKSSKCEEKMTTENRERWQGLS